MNILTNIYFWIIAFFVAVVLFIMLFIVLILIKMKTNAFEELKAFFKKGAVSLFFEDGKFLHMKTTTTEAGIINDPDYGMFIPNAKNTYLGKKTRTLYHVFDTSFAPGISIKAAQTADVLKDHIDIRSDEFIKDLQTQMLLGNAKNEELDCIRSSINVNHIKDLMNYIEPHNINANVQKKVAKHVSALNNKNNTQIILIFLAVFGALIGGYILLKMFNVN